MSFELTFHWFEIELLAIPATLIYYHIAKKFFLIHRKKSSIGANIFITSMRKKLSALATNVREKLETQYYDTQEVDGQSKYFFKDDCSDEDPGYDNLMYDEDQQNHLRNLQNGQELFNDLASVHENQTVSVHGDGMNFGRNFKPDFIIKEDADEVVFRQSSVHVPGLAQRFRKSAFQKENLMTTENDDSMSQKKDLTDIPSVEVSQESEEISREFRKSIDQNSAQMSLNRSAKDDVLRDYLVITGKWRERQDLAQQHISTRGLDAQSIISAALSRGLRKNSTYTADDKSGVIKENIYKRAIEKKSDIDFINEDFVNFTLLCLYRPNRRKFQISQQA